MTPWWRKHSRADQVCESCGASLDVHKGMCRKCRHARRAGEGPGHMGPSVHPGNDPLPESPELEPSHARPWVQRGGA